jgi:hypothetical protein
VDLAAIEGAADGLSRHVIRVGPLEVCLRVGPDDLRAVLRDRYALVEVDPTNAAAFTVDVVAYETEDSDLAIAAPGRVTFVKRDTLVYFGSQDLGNLEIIAGSLGDVGDDLAAQSYLLQFLVETEMLAAIGRHRQCLDFVHAAAVSRNGHASLLVGPSGAGKSTLSIACALRQFDLVCDDIVCVDLAHAQLYPFLKRPNLREEAKRLLKDYSDVTARYADPGGKHRLSTIFILNGFSTEPSLRQLDAQRAFWSLSGQVIRNGRAATTLMSRVASLTAQTRCFELVAGSPEETVAMVARQHNQSIDDSQDLGSA